MEKYDLESILDKYDDDYQKVAEVPRSEMDNFNTPDLEQAPDSYLKPGETLEDFDVTFRRPNAQGGRIPFADRGYVKMTDAERAAAYAKRDEAGNIAKLNKEKNFKNLVDKIFETGDFENFKSKVTEAQLKAAKRAGKVREGTGIIPAQYIKEFNQAIAAGVDSPEFKNLLRITGRSEEEILKLNKLRPAGQPLTKVRSQSTLKYPANYRDPNKELKKLTNLQKTKKKRADAEAVGKKYASEAELNRFKIVNEQKKKLNKFFKENPKALLNTEFGKKIKELMDVRIDENGKFFQKTRPDDYYIAKAKEGKIFDIFDINKISKGQISTKFTNNLNILPGQFNQAFIEGQVNKYFKKGGRLEGQTEILENISKYLDNKGVKVDIEDVGRIGGGDPVFFDSKTNRYPHIENTLKKMNIPDELLTEIKPQGVTLGSNYIKGGGKLLAKSFGDMAMSLGSPTALLGLNAYLGIDPKESLDRAVLGAEVALAPSGIKALMSRIDNIKNPMLRKGIETVAGLRLPGVFTPANVMKAARFASPLGLASLAAEGIYQIGKLGYEDQQRFNALSPEEQAAERAEQEAFAQSIEGA